MKKPAVLRLVVIFGIIAGALSFQNCGPTFVTDENGQVQYSRFDSTQSSVTISGAPSRVKSDFPPTTGTGRPLRGRKEVAGFATDISQYNNCYSGITDCANYNFGLTYRER
ncbi:MAG: hypothetical protein KF767_02585 [Bdellovibrionaceae bacterium]|nr:hypothetical protein [Pseudobdellovibrionaceae bacterium]